MEDQINITFTFVNREGKTKTVRFPFDRKFYQDLFDPSVSEEWRNKILLSSYREYCAECKYRRKTTPLSRDKEGRVIDIPDDSKSIIDDLIEKEEAERELTAVKKVLSRMLPKQRRAYSLVELDGMKQVDAAKEMGMSDSAFSRLYSRARKSFERMMEDKNS